MISSIVSYASPYERTENSKITIIDRRIDNNGSHIREISTYNGSVFYYEETEDCRISMEMLEDGTVIVFKGKFEGESKLNPIFMKGVFAKSNNKIKKLSLEEKVNYLSDLSNSVLTNELALSVVTAEEMGIVSVDENPISNTRSSIADKVYDALLAQEGAEYSDQFLYGKDYRGEYGALYRSKTFQISTYYSWNWGVSTLISAISIAVGFAQPTILKALGSIALSGSSVGLALAEAANSNRYNANVLYEKDVKVNAQVVYTTTKNELNFGLAFEGSDAGDAQLKDRYDNVDNDYNASNSTLIETGINIYLENLS
jgi:hypothetical protein